MDEQIRILQQSLSAAREEIGKLEARVRDLKSALHTTPKDARPIPAKEAHRQLTDLSNSIVESMNRAAEEGLREYRNLLQKETRKVWRSCARATDKSPAPPSRSSKH